MQAQMDLSEPGVAEPTVPDAAGQVVTELNLPIELLAACFGALSLKELPHIARVNRRWREAAQVAFHPQLRWRAQARCRSLPLPVPKVPSLSGQDSQILRTGFSQTFLRGGDLVVQIVDARLDAVRTVSFANGSSMEPCERLARGFADHGPFSAGVGGIVGHHEGRHDGLTFYPMTAKGATAASEAVWPVNGRWQNVLQAGNIVFLLRAHDSWYSDERITADLLDSDTGGRAVVDVTPMRDALKRELLDNPGPAQPTRGAVSAVDAHFIFHTGTTQGAKVAAALRLPAHIPIRDDAAADDPAPTMDAGVAFARRWSALYLISSLPDPKEQVCGEYLLLFEEYSEERVGQSEVFDAMEHFRVQAVLLHASTGVAEARLLDAPAAPSSVAAAFMHGGVAAIDFSPTSGVVAACSLPCPGLPPPAVLVWDWRSALCLHAVLPQPPPEPRLPLAGGGPGPLGFRLHGGEAFAWNRRTQGLEVAANASLVIHPVRNTLVIGQWRVNAAAGSLFSVDMGTDEAQSH